MSPELNALGAASNSSRMLLFGAPEPDEALHTRMLNDLHATLGALINVYGDACRPPVGVLTWPLYLIEPLYLCLQRMAEQLAKAEEARHDQDTYYRALAGAIGLYNDALRHARSLGDRAPHATTSAYVKACQRFIQRCTDPELYIRAAAGDTKQLHRQVLSCCRSTRKRFGDQLQQHGVLLKPPTIAEQHAFSPDTEHDHEH